MEKVCKDGETWFHLLYKGGCPLGEIPDHLRHLMECDRCLDEVWVLISEYELDRGSTELSQDREGRRNFLLVNLLSMLKLTSRFIMFPEFPEEELDKKIVSEIVQSAKQIAKDLQEKKISREEVMEQVRKLCEGMRGFY